MTRPKKPVELNFEDLINLGGLVAKTPAVETPGGPAAEPETGGDLVTSIEGLMERANNVINNIKELIGMWKGFKSNSGPGTEPQQPYTPQPTLIQQLHRLLNILYSAYGDITVEQLLTTLVQQYGGTKLSVVLKALERLQ